MICSGFWYLLKVDILDVKEIFENKLPLKLCWIITNIFKFWICKDVYTKTDVKEKKHPVRKLKYKCFLFCNKQGKLPIILSSPSVTALSTRMHTFFPYTTARFLGFGQHLGVLPLCPTLLTMWMLLLNIEKYFKKWVLFFQSVKVYVRK